jgi:hypothetical protein
MLVGGLASLQWLVLPAKGAALAAAPASAPSPRGGAPTAAGHPANAAPAASPAAEAAWTAPTGTAPAPAGAAAPQGQGAVVLWWVPGAGSVAQGAAVTREVRRLVAAAADELDALAAAARGEAEQGGPGGQPSFWAGAGALQRSLADLDGSLAAGDARFFSFLDAAQSSLVALQVACRRAGPREAAGGAGPDAAEHSPGTSEVARRMNALAATMRRLSGAYGREAARAQLGGVLSAEQARQLRRIARAARRWRPAVAAAAAAARQQGDAAMQSELARLDALLRQLAAAQQLTLAAYLAAIQASNQALALWAGNAAYLEPGEQQAWQQADAGAADLTTAADTGFVFGADLNGGTAWTYAEGTPGGEAGAPGGEAGMAGMNDDVPGAAPGGPDAGTGSPGGGATDAGGATPGDAGEPVSSSPTGAAGTPEGTAAAADGGWVVIHGGPGAGWRPEDSPAAGGAPAFALQLGEAEGADGPLAHTDPLAATADEDAAAGGPDALDWEEICRPWQPSPGRENVCAVPPPADAIAP